MRWQYWPCTMLSLYLKFLICYDKIDGSTSSLILSLLRKRLGAPQFPRLPATRTCSRCRLIIPFSVQTSLFRDSYGCFHVSFHYPFEDSIQRRIPFFVGAPLVYTSSHCDVSVTHPEHNLAKISFFALSNSNPISESGYFA